MQVGAQQAVQGEVVVLHLVVSLGDAAVSGLQDGHGVLGDCVRGIGRYTQDGDAALLGGVQIHVVEASAAEQDQTDAVLLHLLHHRTGRLVVDEHTHGVKAPAQMDGLSGQTAVKIGDLTVVSAFALVFGQFFKEDLVIGLGAVEGDLQNIQVVVCGDDMGENLLQSCIIMFFFFRSAFQLDVQDIALLGTQCDDGKHICAGCGHSVAFDGDGTFQAGTFRCQDRSRACMKPQGCFASVLKRFHNKSSSDK